MTLDPDIRRVVERYWGFPSLRPLQQQAIGAALSARDALVVMPTGGGKSLCYQLPPLVLEDLTVVVSPLISLMKDQVDALRAIGVSASQVDSTSSTDHRRRVARSMRDKSLRLLFVSPERLAMSSFVDFLAQTGVARFAVDEAHCISHWGHDFRPEYRQLASLRERFPDASFHAFTATATRRVREDIARELGLDDPEILVGSFDRPNLTFRVIPRHDPLKQILEVLARHDREGGIIYCIRRRDVDELAAKLRKQGIEAQPYHAGMTQEERQKAQDAFASESCDVMVATVAFGMGIDRSNIRYVIHAAMPKSIEHYQQETGRAGRDGLDAECVLLYSGADVVLWRSIIERSAEEYGSDPDVKQSVLRHIEEMNRYARGSVCRHRALVQYFDQEFDGANCGACDLCLDETTTVQDAQVIAQKILSCVARLHERFGAGYVVKVLRGENDARVLGNGHDSLSTFGLLRDTSVVELRDWIWQLSGQGLVEVTADEYPILKLNEGSREVMRGTRDVRLVAVAQSRKRTKKQTKGATPLDTRDSELFEALRLLRKEIARERGVPAFVIFGDVTLHEMARLKPATRAALATVHGVGQVKLQDFGPRFLDVVIGYVERVSSGERS